MKKKLMNTLRIHSIRRGSTVRMGMPFQKAKRRARANESQWSYPNAGEKGTPPDNEDDPPRERGNKQWGRGTMQNDRPPVFGVAGRESSQVRLQVSQDATGETIQDFFEDNIHSQSTVNSNENLAYKFLENTAYEHCTVKNSEHEFARDED